MALKNGAQFIVSFTGIPRNKRDLDCILSRLVTRSSRLKDLCYAKIRLWRHHAVFTSRLFFSCKPGHHAFTTFCANDLPLPEGKNDLSILSVRDATSEHELEQTPVATGFQDYVLESKLDCLTNSILKMSDSLARLIQPHRGLYNSKDDDALLE